MTTPATVKLSITAMFRGAFAAVFGQFRGFVKVAALPFALTVALNLLAMIVFPMVFPIVFPDPLSLRLFSLASFLLHLLPLAIFSAALTQVILREPEAKRSPLLGRRTWLYFGYLSLILFGVVFFTLSVGPTSNAIAAYLAHETSLVLLLIGFFWNTALFYFCMRISLVLPAASLGESLGPIGSWQLTRGNNLGFLTIAGVLTLASALLLWTGQFLPTAAADFVVWFYISFIPAEHHAWISIFSSGELMRLAVALFAYFGAGLLTGGVASAYAQLTGRGRPRLDILERFE